MRMEYRVMGAGEVVRREIESAARGGWYAVALHTTPPHVVAHFADCAPAEAVVHELNTIARLLRVQREWIDTARTAILGDRADRGEVLHALAQHTPVVGG